MRFVSLFSGIEAASVAWIPLGWEAVAFAEIEPFPCAVLAQRFPDVPNLGDVTKIDWSEFLARYGAVDLVCGGSPCQSFSIAAGENRTSLDGPSRLMFEYIRAVRELRPRWFVWENVPGVLNTRDDAFGCLLDQMDESGYSTAWRVLDAQFFGVAQRRARVWAVGASRDAFGDLAAGRAAAVLFERESVRGNTVTSKQKRQELTRAAEGRAGGSYTLKLRHTGSDLTAGAGGVGPLVQDDVSATLATNQDQTLFCLQTDHMGQNGTNVSVEVCKTLDVASSTPVICAGGEICGGFVPGMGAKAQGIGYEEEQSPTLKTDGAPAVVTAHQNASGDVHISEEVTGTIISGASVSRQNIICVGSEQANAAINHELCATLDHSNNRPLICVGSDSSKPAIDEDMASTLHVGGGAPWIATSCGD